MYRDDKEALHHRVDSLSREADALRAENQAIRAAAAAPGVSPMSLPPGAVYAMDVRALPLAERGRLANHGVRPFPVWATGILTIVTLGLFPLIWFGMQHDRLPRAAHNDPSAGKAIGFSFIPYFSLYWIFFNSLRLCDRLDLQLRLRDRTERAPKGLLIAACILTVIPYGIIIALPTLWVIANCLLQSAVNTVASLDPGQWVATPSPYDQQRQAQQAGPAAGAPIPQAVAQRPYAMGVPMTEEQKEQALRAKKFVNWSHLLGWGGLALLVFGTMAGGIAFGPMAALVVGGLSVCSVVVGAILGQIGRGMQGRAI